MMLVHGGIISDAFEALASELTLASKRFRVITIRRRGYGGSSRVASPFSIQDQARDCLALMDGLDLKKTHFAGHSMSGLIGLQLANDVPERVSSLSLIEPSLIALVPSAAQAAQAQSQIGALYQSGDKIGAIDTFMRGVSGEGYRNTMDRGLPAGWFEQALQDLDTFFQIDLPAIRSWRLETRERIKQPILSVYGIERRWGGRVEAGAEFDQLLHAWFNQTVSLPIAGAYHWPHVTNTVELAGKLTGFLERTS